MIAVENGGPNLKQKMGAPLRPSHLLLFDHPSGDQGTVRNSVREADSSLSDEPFAEDDGELGLGLEPLTRRPLPFFGRVVENEI
jgi:hypothetical protein